MTRGFHSIELAIKARPEYFDEKVLKLADALEEDVKRKNARISFLESEKSHLKEENRRRKSNEEKLEKENKRLTQKIESLENEMAEQKDELDLAKAAVANLRAVFLVR